jgi:hypothetical protein
LLLLLLLLHGHVRRLDAHVLLLLLLLLLGNTGQNYVSDLVASHICVMVVSYAMCGCWKEEYWPGLFCVRIWCRRMSWYWHVSWY